MKLKCVSPGRFLSLFCVLIPALVLVAAVPSAPTCLDNEDLGRQLKKLAADHRQIIRVSRLADSAAKRPLWLAELGRGSDEQRARRPAMLVLAGVDGNDLSGSVGALAWIEHLARNSESDVQVRRLLDSSTLYVVPRLNPDAAEFFFAKPRREVAVSSLPADEDHDGLVDEDPPEDLDGDGLIAWMRVEDPEGEYIPDSADPRLLLKADRARGEPGAWRLYPEGRDSDQDEAWNEDPVGGVNFNRNFPHNFRFFAAGSGAHPVSEIETRSLADFVIAHPNIGIVFTFGMADNLLQTPKAEPAGRRPATGIQEADLPYYRELGKVWREGLGLKKEISGASEPGTFSDWIYFHRGRLSLAARSWSPALQFELSKTQPNEKANDTEKEKEKEKAKAGEEDVPPKDAEAGKSDRKDDAPAKKTEPDTRNEEERAFLKWLDQHAPDRFVPWKSFAHPDFPGRKVEIGGFAPFARTLPPEKVLAELAARQAAFLTALAGKLPRIAIRKAQAKPLGNSVYEVVVQIENTGYLPTALAQGTLSREVSPTRVVLDLDSKAFLSGSRIATLGAIDGSGGMKESRWVVHAKNRKSFSFEVISALGGRLESAIELKELQ